MQANAPHGPRQINELRRVCLPTKIVRPLGLHAGGWVQVAQSAGNEREIMISPVQGPTASASVRDPRRARRVGRTGQLSLPAPVMEAVGLTVGSAVYFVVDGAAVRLVPASRIRAVRARAGAVS